MNLSIGLTILFIIPVATASQINFFQIEIINNLFFNFLNIFIDYVITVVPFPPHSTPSCLPPPSHIPPL